MRRYLIVAGHSPGKKKKKKKLASSAELTALQQMVADNTPFISLHQPVSRLFSTAPVCFPNTDCPSEKTALQDGSSLTFKQKKVQIHTFDSGLFLRQKREWKFPSVKLPPAIRPLISGVIFSFCVFSLCEGKSFSVTDFAHIIPQSRTV